MWRIKFGASLAMKMLKHIDDQRNKQSSNQVSYFEGSSSRAKRHQEWNIPLKQTVSWPPSGNCLESKVEETCWLTVNKTDKTWLPRFTKDDAGYTDTPARCRINCRFFSQQSLGVRLQGLCAPFQLGLTLLQILHEYATFNPRGFPQKHTHTFIL